MKLPFINQSLRSESGQAIIFGSFFVLGLMILGGLAIDTAHVFVKKAKVQRAADASAMAAITRYAEGITDPDTIENAAEDIANYNLAQMGVTAGEIQNVAATLTVDENNVATLDLDVDIDANTFFMRLIPGEAFDTVDIGVAASSRRVPAQISLVLDTSGSMSGELDDLKAAAIAFVNSFEDGLDEIAVIRFALTAEVLQPMAVVDKTNLANIINGLSANGYTNIAHGLKLGRLEIENAANPDSVKAVVLFTDGAPNALVPYLVNGKDWEVSKNYPESSPVYYQYLIETLTRRVRDHETHNQICSRVKYCFYDFEYLDSRMEVMPDSDNVYIDSKNDLTREAFNLAVRESDYGKDDGVAYYSIGLGEPDSVTSTAYQDVTDTAALKTFLLRRISNDPAGKNDPSFPNFPNESSHPAGIYFETPDSADLVDLFQAVAKRLKLRLIQ